jgi:hypothetical protein
MEHSGFLLLEILSGLVELLRSLYMLIELIYGKVQISLFWYIQRSFDKDIYSHQA